MGGGMGENVAGKIVTDLHFARILTSQVKKVSGLLYIGKMSPKFSFDKRKKNQKFKEKGFGFKMLGDMPLKYDS